MSNIGGYFKSMTKSCLKKQEEGSSSFHIAESLNFEENAIRNRVWYRGDPCELNKFYQEYAKEDSYFWSTIPKEGSGLRKIHSGVPSLIVDTLSNIVVRDMGNVQLEDRKEDWKAIQEENEFTNLINKLIKETLTIGDGAIKLTFSRDLSEYPIIEFYPGDKIELVYERGRYKETIFKNVHKFKNKTYIHYEKYGYGYIKNTLKESGSDNLLELLEIPQTAALVDIKFGGYNEDDKGRIISKGSFNMAIPVKISTSSKYNNRGKSIFDNKIYLFDALDEVISQWMDLTRLGRANKYISANLAPRDKIDCCLLEPGEIDHKFIKVKGISRNKGKDQIQATQSIIQIENYSQSYIAYLNLCLQGIVAPSTLGIYIKNTYNIEAQSEKEKAPFYITINIVKMLQNLIPKIVNTALKVLDAMNETTLKVDVAVKIDFDECSKPSFETINEIMDETYKRMIKDI